MSLKALYEYVSDEKDKICNNPEGWGQPWRYIGLICISPLLGGWAALYWIHKGMPLSYRKHNNGYL